MPYHEEDEDEEEDRDLPQAADMDDEDSAEGDEDLVRCPYCGKSIYDGAEVCPYCKSYVSAEDAPPSRKPVWLIVGVAVCIVLVVLAWVLA
jgi:hypothetical protein